jgi:hypothetical protein
MANVRAHATAYIGTHVRVAQDSNMMYVFLKESLTEGARSRMANEHEKYDINGSVSDSFKKRYIMLESCATLAWVPMYFVA